LDIVEATTNAHADWRRFVRVTERLKPSISLYPKNQTWPVMIRLVWVEPRAVMRSAASPIWGLGAAHSSSVVVQVAP
jgi:hypothetical protein